MTPPHILEALDAHRVADAASLLLEYMALTQEESGRAKAAAVDDLPPVLAAECRTVAETYAAPGTMLLAYVDDVPIGCVGLKHLPRLNALELTRLYVRAGHRRAGVGRALVARAQAHAATAGVERIVLDVMPSRTQAMAFYSHLGYTTTSAYRDLSYPMVAMHRYVRATDLPTDVPTD